MFERNRVDNKTAMSVAVEITLSGGEMLAGRAALPAGKAVHQLLDPADPFLFVEGYDGESAFVPKSDVKGLKVLSPVRLNALSLAVPDATSFDPHRVLGVGREAAWEEIRAAYHRATKLYHPDRYAGVELPPEVSAYLEGMAKAVNIAFRALRSSGRAKVA